MMRFRSLQFSFLASSGRGAVPGEGGFAGTLCTLSITHAEENWASGNMVFSQASTNFPGFCPSAFSGRPTIQRLFLLRRFSRSSAFSTRIIIVFVLLCDTLHVMSQQPYVHLNLLRLFCERGVGGGNGT